MPRPAAARAAAMRADIVDLKSIWSSSGESGGGAGTGLWATGAAIRSSSDVSASSSTSNLSMRTAGDAGSQPTAPRASGPGDRRCSASESSSDEPPDCTSSSGGAFIGVCAGVVAGVDASEDKGWPDALAAKTADAVTAPSDRASRNSSSMTTSSSSSSSMCCSFVVSVVRSLACSCLAMASSFLARSASVRDASSASCVLASSACASFRAFRRLWALSSNFWFSASSNSTMSSNSETYSTPGGEFGGLFGDAWSSWSSMSKIWARCSSSNFVCLSASASLSRA
jgi:hypothetical protein